MEYRFAVLGSPVKHSRSPQLHRAMLRLSGLEGEYVRVEADADVLAETTSGLRTGEWHGLNVTMPLKAVAARMAETLSPQASRAGSVNTLSLRDSRIHGESTDSIAFGELLSSGRFGDGKTVVVLGAGGSAAAALAAIPVGVDAYVAARRESRAGAITARMGGGVIPWGGAVPGAVVVNTTPLGMAGEHLPAGVLEAAAGLIDLPYGADPTPAVSSAERLGIPYADGHEFLMRQAIASFASWTGVTVALETLQEALRKA